MKKVFLEGEYYTVQKIMDETGLGYSSARDRLSRAEKGKIIVAELLRPPWETLTESQAETLDEFRRQTANDAPLLAKYYPSLR